MSSTGNAPADHQLCLLDVLPVINCTSCASARNAYGNAAQEVVYRLLGVTPIRINGNYATCFDGVKGGVYYEIKSTRLKSGKVVVYDWRIGKEQAAGVTLHYLLVCHSLQGHRADILGTMLRLPVVIYSLPAPVLHDWALRCPLQKLKRDARNKREGYYRGGYKDGYRNLPLKQITEHLTFTEERIENPLGPGQVLLRTLTQKETA